MAIEVAVSFLASQRHRAIVVLGGPGRPDVLSLDQSGKLRITEVKGTRSGTSLAQAGLLRTVSEGSEDPLSTIKLFENSPEWLRRNSADVLTNLKQMEMAATNASQRAHLQDLAHKWGKAIAKDFRLNDEYSTEIIQVGFSSSGEGLPFLEPSTMLHAYCGEVQPERIVQIDLEAGGLSDGR
jgi:hypothetical protein